MKKNLFFLFPMCFLGFKDLLAAEDTESKLSSSGGRQAETSNIALTDDLIGTFHEGCADVKALFEPSLMNLLDDQGGISKRFMLGPLSKIASHDEGHRFMNPSLSGEYLEALWENLKRRHRSPVEDSEKLAEASKRICERGGFITESTTQFKEGLPDGGTLRVERKREGD